MHTLTFTCPQTGRAIDAGINTDAYSLSSVQAVIIHVKCPFCGMKHQLPIKSGYLAAPPHGVGRAWRSVAVAGSHRTGPLRR
jgi:hypothetical protein